MPLLTSGSRLIRHKATSSNGLLTNLVAYWGLDEAAGANNALDKHSNGLTMTQNASPGSTAGKVYAGARTFVAASSQYFARSSDSLLQISDIDFVIALWVYPTTSASMMLVARDSGSAGSREFYINRTSASQTQFIIFGAANAAVGVVNGAGIPQGQWTLVTAWHDANANTVSVAINNDVATSASTTGAPTAKTVETCIGRRTTLGSELYASGTMGPVMFWKNRILDATARTALYNAGAGLTYAAFTA